MANTFIQLTDTPSDYQYSSNKYVRVNADGTALQYWNIELDHLDDVQSSGAYTPSTGEALIYSADGKWRPGTMDVYSTGNGLNKSGLTLNVQAGSSGGLVSNASGIFIEDIANVSGTYGNSITVPQITVNSKGQITSVTEVTANAQYAQNLSADYVGSISGTSGQIQVTGGTGNNASATVNLVATGVSAGTYGNATLVPQVTVDSYGRVQHIDLIPVASSGNGSVQGNALSFSRIAVNGQTTVSAESSEDIVTFEAGTGVVITTNANADSVTFSTNSSAIATGIDLADLQDVDAVGITNGQVLAWNSSTNKFEAADQTGSGGGNSNVSLSDFSVVTATPSGNGSLVYDNAGEFTFTPANLSATAQTLTWNASTYVLGITNGNSVNLSVLVDSVSSYGDSNVQSYLDAQGYSNVEQTLSINNSSNVITISGSNSTVDLTSVLANATANVEGFATESYVDNAVANVVASANVNLDSLAEVANALNNSNAQLSTVAFTGNFSDIQSRPSISLSGSDLTYDGTTLDLSGLGAQGPQGNVGPAGADGADGADGLTVTTATVTAGNLIIGLSDNSNIDAGEVIGETGVGVTGVSITSGNLIFDYSNTSTQDLGSVVGPQGNVGPAGSDGADGADGVSIDSANVEANGNLIITLTDASTVDAGNVRGQDGAGTNQTISLDDGSNVLTISGSNSTVDFSNILANVSGGGGTGDIEGVTAGTGLSGGGTSGNVTVNLANTTVASGTYGNSTHSPRITIDPQGRITNASEVAISGAGGGGARIERFKLNYNASGNLVSVEDETSGIANVTIDSATGGEVTVEFNSGSYNLPPGAITMYGYDYTNNKYAIVPMDTSMGYREIAAGGSSGSPTLFDGNSTLEVNLRLREAETGASRGGLGTTTHAWIQFVMYD